MDSNKFKSLSIFDRSRNDLSELEKIEMIYGFEDFEESNNFLYRNFFRPEMGFELKLGKLRSIFDFRKLIKITMNGPKIQEFAWRYEIQFGTLFIFATCSKSPRVLN
jgi:hypothetical protein